MRKEEMRWSQTGQLLRLGACLFLAIVPMLLGTIASGQSSVVIGTITHQNGSAAVDVLVTVGGNWRYTDQGGRYRIEGVPLGTQRMIIKSGKNILWQGDVQVHAGTTTIDRSIP